MQFPNVNDMVSVSDLARLNESLRKAGTVGYQTGAVPASDALSPLVPQSIEGTLASATYTEEELVFFKNIPKKSVSQTLHEYVVVKDHGFELDPFITEGGGGQGDFATNQSSYERKNVKIKYMAERRQISDVASLVGLIGDNRQALAEETMRGTLSLLRKVERQLWYGNEGINANGFDGVIKQIEDGAQNNTLNLAGKAPTPNLLQEALGEVYSSPNFGRPDTIYVEPRIHAELIKQAVSSGRHDQFMVQQQTQGLTFGANNLTIMAPYGGVQVKAAPFLHYASNMPTAAFGTSAPSAPTAAAGFAATRVTESTSTLENNKAYKYKVVSLNALGYSAPSVELTETPIPAAGDKESIKITIPVTNLVNSFRIYRTAADGNDSTYKLIAEVKADSANAVIFEDRGSSSTCVADVTGVAVAHTFNQYNTSPIVMVQHDPNVLEFARLLDFLRRPLAEVATAKPFLLMLFGSPIVKVPTKCFLMTGAGAQANSGNAYNPATHFNP